MAKTVTEAPRGGASDPSIPATRKTPNKAPSFKAWRAPLFFLLALSVLAGLDAALVRIGAAAPVNSVGLGANHGWLMIIGFLGAAITLERAVAAGVWWAYLAPTGTALAALGWMIQPLLHATGVAHAPGGGHVALLVVQHLIGVGILLAGLILAAAYVRFYRRVPQRAFLIAALGAFDLVICAIGWFAGLGISQLLLPLLGFPIFTIISERLELARLHFSSRAEDAVLALSTLAFVASLLAFVAPNLGSVLWGYLLLALTVVVWSSDVARKTWRREGQTRFMAVAMLAGYFWLAVAAVIWAVAGELTSGPAYEAAIHAVTLGFAFSMILAHAPVIFPALTGRPLPWRPFWWVLLGALHASLWLRLGVGLVWQFANLWQWAASLNVVTVLGLVVTVLVTAVVQPWLVANIQKEQNA
ncbi:hypothetical protein [Boudabousia liubingyangii]|uniref:hypothetical protein n=1 Tax=Boudabousia liubingyangii TaxID=1921764 RepID=UPI0009FB5803|nr:hypothetical protein [Boudabousia liubingyangii]